MHVACRAGPPPAPHVSAPGPALPPPLLPWHGGQTGPSTDSSSAQRPPTPGACSPLAKTALHWAMGLHFPHKELGADSAAPVPRAVGSD